MRLSPRESQALSFIALWIEQNGKPPYQYQIAAHLGARSRGFVWRVLKKLEAKGQLRRETYKVRGLQILKTEHAEAA